MASYSYSTSNIITKFTNAQNVTTNGTTKQISLSGIKDGRLRRVKVAKISGGAPSFVVYVYDKEGSVATVDTIFEYDTDGDVNADLVDENVDIIFKNQDQVDCLWMRIVPSTGTNNFDIRVDAIEGDKWR